MKRRSASLLLSSSIFLGLPVGAQEEPKPAEETEAASNGEATRDRAIPELIAVITPTVGNTVMGTVTFKYLGEDRVEVSVRLVGFEPLTMHGFHIHQFGDLSGGDGSTAGGHFNPEGHSHGLPPKERRHAGDLGNVMADEDGQVSKTFTVDVMKLTGKNSILGRAVVVHEKMDTGEDPSGDAGARLAHGVIGYRFKSK